MHLGEVHCTWQVPAVGATARRVLCLLAMRALLLAFLAALLPACAADDGTGAPGGLGPIQETVLGTCDDEPLEPPGFEHVLVPAGFSVADDDRPAPPPLMRDADGAGDPAIVAEAAGEDVCACATVECVTAWIEQNVGCDVCAHALCGDGEGTVGGCVACDDSGSLDAGAPRPQLRTACVDRAVTLRTP